MEFDFLSIGEVMVQFNPLFPGPLRYVKYFETHVAGSEANMLIGLSKLGYKTRLITRLGKDEFGYMIYNFLRGEGVDVSRIVFDEHNPTGIYFIQRHFPLPNSSTVFYYRKNSAATKISEKDVDENDIEDTEYVILTGITPALSSSCYRAVRKMFSLARKKKKKIVFDTNIRMKLFSSEEKARKTISPFLSSNIIFTNTEDLAVLFPGKTIDDAVHHLLKNSELIVIKLGEKGSMAFDKDGRKYEAPPIRHGFVTDVIGAGDAFNAAVIASLARGYSVGEALLHGNIAGSLTVLVRGDVENQPSWRDIEVIKESMKKSVFLR